MHEDPITLHIALDKEQKAEGTLYIDDGQSFEYKEGKFIYVTFKYEKGTLEAKLNQPAGIETKVWLEKVVVLGSGPANNPAKVTDKTGEKYVDTLYDSSTGALIIRKPGVNLGSGFTISLN